MALEKFGGTWKVVSDENMDEYFKEMGVPLVKRQVAKALKPEVKIIVSDKTITIVRTGPIRKHEEKCTLDVEGEVTTPDGDKVKQITKLSEDGELISELQPVNKKIKPSIIKRTLNGDGNEMIAELTVKSDKPVTAKRKFKKIS